MALTPILPKRKPFDAAKHQKVIDAFLRGFSSDFVRAMAAYPPARPWRNPPPRTGPRAGGRRTGTLGRNWSSRIRFTRNSVTIENPTPYGVHVQGPRPGRPRRRQTDVMAARNWPNVTDVGKRTYKKHADKMRKALR